MTWLLAGEDLFTLLLQGPLPKAIMLFVRPWRTHSVMPGEGLLCACATGELSPGP